VSHEEGYQIELERYEQACEAINRCAKAGANIEDLKTLAREAGIDIKHTILGDEIRPTRVG
jgi:hypothetical protein